MSGKISKLLIANRGEIACRIIRTARKMGIETVAIYSDADGEHGAPLFVRMADEAIPIGPRDDATGQEPYLLADRIIGAAKASGADAIHPGYGFLSENPGFVEAVEAAGLIFVGPSPASIRAMGLKDAAKALMEKAGVPVVPGYHGDMQDPGFLAAKASEIGYPVLIKARAGGGGKGMRKVKNAKDFAAALGSCKSEAKKSFGDDRVLIEKYVTSPRHIEVQVFGDNHGNVVHLFERDCSLQRRHQKVIEEAPAPGMTDEMRDAMTSAAVKAAQAISYSGAGTIEFIVDGSDGLRPDGFWFMEMNTRLQVEHPVTEEVTGVDLVEWQLRVASGEELPLAQDEIRLSGHSFEARLYAEDVPKGFLPAIGTLQHMVFADEARIETGVEQGDTISPYYDPMIAKVISIGNNREEALIILHAALRHTKVAGTVTNKTFLSALTLHEGFSRGEVDTGLIERDLESLVRSKVDIDQAIVIATLILSDNHLPIDPSEPFEICRDFVLWGPSSRVIRVQNGDDMLEMLVSRASNGEFSCRSLGAASIAAWNAKILDHPRNRNAIEIIYDEKEIGAQYVFWPGHLALFIADETFEFILPDPLEAAAVDAHGADAVIAPMPGLVKQLNAVRGAVVTKGDPLLVLEAMKMEHTLTAPRDGILAEINTAQGAQVEDGAILITLEAEDDIKKGKA